MIPYTAAAVATLLRSMPSADLQRAVAADFQRWPAQAVIKGGVLSEMIANEKARRQ